jgi:thioredoxin reductase
MGEVLDCVVVGGGPGGLTAAIYLGRFRRRFVVLDAGDSRLDWIPSATTIRVSRRRPGPELLARMQTQARTYGAEIRHAKAVAAIRDAQGVVHRAHQRRRRTAGEEPAAGHRRDRQRAGDPGGSTSWSGGG